MVMADCSRKDLEKSLEKETPLFNLSIELHDWEGPFKNFDYFLGIAKIAKEYSHLRGDHHVTSEGDIKYGKLTNLHTFKAEIDLAQKDHIHYGKNVIILPLQTLTTVNRKELPSHPVYTLRGLYATIPERHRTDRISKLNKLSEEFLLRNKKLESIAKNPKTIIKLLENKYRREISDQ
jgi:hypothetical protein